MKIEGVRPSREDEEQIKKIKNVSLKNPEEALLETGNVLVKKKIQKTEGEDTSNIFLVEIKSGDKRAEGVFKPCGEDHGINCRCAKEKGAYLVSKTLGFNIVPVTEVRNVSAENFGIEDVGSIQLFDYGEVADNAHLDDNEESIMKLRIFDYVIWNYDRHDWNYLVTSDGKTVAIDNELSFGAEDNSWARKEIITDMEDIAGKQLPEDVMDIFEKYQNDPRVGIKLKKSLKGLIDDKSINAILTRIDKISKFILTESRLPKDDTSLDTLTYK